MSKSMRRPARRRGREQHSAGRPHRDSAPRRELRHGPVQRRVRRRLRHPPRVVGGRLVPVPGPVGGGREAVLAVAVATLL